MKINVQRFSAGNEATLGLLFIGKFFWCYTLEDEKRAEKVYGETRIPAGIYNLKLRTHGNHHERYSQKFPEFHQGMIEILDVPGFTDILIHIGNDDDDTAGCLLVGNCQRENLTGNGALIDSTKAYERFYRAVVGSVEKGFSVIEIKDETELEL